VGAEFVVWRVRERVGVLVRLRALTVIKGHEG
jgi:hypothetical protein